MNSFEKFADSIRKRSVNLLRFDAHLRQEMLKLLADLEVVLVGKLVTTDLTAFERRRLSALLDWTADTISTAFERIDARIQPELRGLAAAEGVTVAKMLKDAISDVVAVSAPSSTMLKKLADDVLVRGAPATEWWGRQAETTRARFADMLRVGVARGDTNQQLVQALRGTKAMGYKDGIMELTRRDADAIVRTSVQAVANGARAALFEENDDVLNGYVYHSVLDGRTTVQCAVLDGLKWRFDGTPVGHTKRMQRPPIHWRCRSTLLPWIKSWKELGLKIDELSDSTRSSMDGQVKVQNFESWLSTKPVDFQNELLGKGKAALWRAGKIGFSDLIDQTGRPLTLEQLT